MTDECDEVGHMSQQEDECDEVDHLSLEKPTGYTGRAFYGAPDRETMKQAGLSLAYDVENPPSIKDFYKALFDGGDHVIARKDFIEDSLDKWEEG